MIHTAYLDDPKEGRIWFASVDGETWLSVSRKPELEDEEALADLFRPRETVDSDGHKYWFSTMKIATRYLRWQRATFVEPIGEPREHDLNARPATAEEAARQGKSFAYVTKKLAR